MKAHIRTVIAPEGIQIQSIYLAIFEKPKPRIVAIYRLTYGKKNSLLAKV